MAFLKAKGVNDPVACRRQIEEAIEALRHSPLRCQVAGMKGRLTFRQLVVDRRFLVFYVYAPPRGMNSGGTLSIRSVKHAASQNPFLDVREVLPVDRAVGALRMHDSAEAAIA
jgi:hypothetical protein